MPMASRRVVKNRGFSIAQALEVVTNIHVDGAARFQKGFHSGEFLAIAGALGVFLVIRVRRIMP